MQIYGTKKCQLTKKAERFFSERRISYHFVDLAKYSPTRGELENIKRGAGVSLINTESPAFIKRGLSYMDYDEIDEIVRDPQLLLTPVVREGNKVVLGHDEEAWRKLIN